VCDDGWATIDANIACRQLGYSGSGKFHDETYIHSFLGLALVIIYNLCFTDATAHSNAAYGQNTNIIIALDDVACTTAQSRLIDCTYDSNTGDCSHSDDAGVTCVAREFLCW